MSKLYYKQNFSSDFDLLLRESVVRFLIFMIESLNMCGYRKKDMTKGGKAKHNVIGFFHMGPVVRAQSDKDLISSW